MITVEARSRCALCGCWLPSLAFPSVRVNRRSMRQLPGEYLTVYPDRCPECGWSHRARSDLSLMPPQPGGAACYLASPWRLTAGSAREVAGYRQRRWPA